MKILAPKDNHALRKANYRFILIVKKWDEEPVFIVNELYSEIVDYILKHNLNRRQYKIFFEESLTEVTEYYYDLIF